jgi:hypothetical protein
LVLATARADMAAADEDLRDGRTRAADDVFAELGL